MAKRGRKRVNKRYFDDREEEALKIYLKTHREAENFEIDYNKQKLKVSSFNINSNEIFKFHIQDIELYLDTSLELHLQCESSHIDYLKFIEDGLSKFDAFQNAYLANYKNHNAFCEIFQSYLIEYLKLVKLKMNFEKAEFEKGKIYEVFLEAPLDKMAESIINKYKLYSHFDNFETLKLDVLSDLHTKLHKFDTSRGKKAYSYFGTIMKNYAIGRRMKEQKNIERESSYEAQQEYFKENEKYSYSIEKEDSEMKEYFYNFREILRKDLEKNEKEEDKRFKDNESLLGYSILKILDNWETSFESNGKKFDKNHILLSLRNITGMDTGSIRKSMKKIKELYFNNKKIKIDNSYHLKLKENKN